jgi:hypothetical protein
MFCILKFKKPADTENKLFQTQTQTHVAFVFDSEKK